MPIPIGLAAMGAMGAAGGGAQAISGAFKSPYEKHQEEELRKMKAQQARGARGISKAAAARRHRANVDPGVQQMEFARRRGEALAAATGQATGAHQQQGMQAQQQATGRLMQGSAMDIQAADERKAEQQEAREQQTAAAIEAARKERRQRVFSGLGQMVGAAGLMAGSVPEVTRAADVAGTPIRDPDAFEEYLRNEGVPEDSLEVLRGMNRRQLTRTLQQVQQGDLSNPDAQKLDALLRDEVNDMLVENLTTPSRRGSMAEASMGTLEDEQAAYEADQRAYLDWLAMQESPGTYAENRRAYEAWRAGQ